MSTTNEHTAKIYIHWSDHTDRYTAYKVPYEIAIAIDKLLEKKSSRRKKRYQVCLRKYEERTDYKRGNEMITITTAQVVLIPVIVLILFMIFVD